MRIYSPDPAVIEQGVRYLRITTFVFVIHGTSLVAEQLMRSVGQARLGLVVSSISFVVNLIANYIFIFGKFGAPRMEIAGAALGTLFARIAEFLVTFGYIFFRDCSLHFRFSHLFRKVERSLLMNYLRLGGPGLARMADHPLSADRLCHQIGLVRHTVKERKMDTFCGGRLSPGTKLKIF